MAVIDFSSANFVAGPEVELELVFFVKGGVKVSHCGGAKGDH
jgi:hypothetical protein